MSVAHGGDVWDRGRPEDFLDFSANLNPDGPPQWAREAMARGLARAGYYPDARSRAALAGLSGFLGVPRECLMATAGGVEAGALAATLPGRHVIVQPTFAEYARLCGPHEDLPAQKLKDYTPRPGENLWLCNPNNPTGAALRLEGLLEAAEAAGARLIVDEAFIDYCPGYSLRRFAGSGALVILGSLTKVLALPGVRLGYLEAHPAVIEALGARALPWRLNCLADAVAAALPGHGAYFERVRALNAARRADFAERLARLGARVYPSEANFLLCDFHRDMRPVAGALRERGMPVRLCGGFEGLDDGHVRLCVRRQAENQRLIGALEELL